MGSAALTLTTSRLVLRPVSPADVGPLRRICNEPAVRRHLWDDEPVPETTVRGLVVRSARMFAEEGVGLFGVRLRGDEDLLGFCGFARLGVTDEPELCFGLTSGAWGRGLATEAARACLRNAFEEAGLGRVIAGADPPNAASLRVIEKLGMKPAGNLNPKNPNEPHYALIRQRFTP